MPESFETWKAHREKSRIASKHKSLPCVIFQSSIYCGYANRKLTAMTNNEVFALLEANRNERAVKNWEKTGLGTTAIEALKAIGPVAPDPNDHCEPFDVLKHLTSDYLKKKFAA